MPVPSGSAGVDRTPPTATAGSAEGAEAPGRRQARSSRIAHLTVHHEAQPPRPVGRRVPRSHAYEPDSESTHHAAHFGFKRVKNVSANGEDPLRGGPRLGAGERRSPATSLCSLSGVARN